MRITIPTFRISSLLRPLALQAWLVYFAFAVYSLLILAVFVGLVRPWINGDIMTRIGADSDRYWAAARLLFDPEHTYGSGLLSFGSNYFGPVVVAAVVKRQSLVVAFNFALLFLSVRIASTIRGVAAYVFIALLMVNVETGVALITLNKEIFCVISAVLIAKYLVSENHSLLYLGLALLTSLVARWEQAALVLLVALFTRKKSFFSRRHKLAIFYVVAGITIVYPLAIRFLGRYLGAFTQYAQVGGIILRLNHLQETFGFPLVMIPKILLNVLGRLSRPTYYVGQFWEDGFIDIHSQILLPLFSMALVTLLLVAWARGKLAVNRPVALLIFIYLIGTAVTPFVQPRYEYFVYVLLCVEVARHEPSSEPLQPSPKLLSP